MSGVEKLHAGEHYSSQVSDNFEETRYIHAAQGQKLFDFVKENAASKGMKLNPKKTTLLCLSAAKTYKPKTYIRTGEDNDIIISGSALKLQRFHFDSNPTAAAHVKAILKKVRYRTWSIHNLKQLEVSAAGLVNVYKALV